MDQSNEFTRESKEKKLFEIQKQLERYTKEEELIIRMMKQESNPVPVLGVTQGCDQISEIFCKKKRMFIAYIDMELRYRFRR